MAEMPKKVGTRGRPKTSQLSRKEQVRVAKRRQRKLDAERATKEVSIRMSAETYTALAGLARHYRMYKRVVIAQLVRDAEHRRKEFPNEPLDQVAAEYWRSRRSQAK